MYGLLRFPAAGGVFRRSRPPVSGALRASCPPPVTAGQEKAEPPVDAPAGAPMFLRRGRRRYAAAVV